MKKYLYLFISLLLSVNNTFAWNAWVFNESDVTEKDLRTGNIHTDDIPGMITSAINFFMWIAGTVAIIFVIIWAYKILLGSLQQDKTKWKDTIIMALMWFALASLAWFIIRIIIDNFSV